MQLLKCNCLEYHQLYRITENLKRDGLKKKHARRLHWGDFTSWAKNETKNDSNIKDISSSAMGSIYVEVDNLFTMLSNGDMK